MSGQCYRCASQFGLFKKEVGCKNCGYSFCTSCLKKKIAVPKHNNEIHKVCEHCFDILSGKVKKEDLIVRMSPPENYKKRIAKLQNPTPSQTSSSGKAASKTTSQKKYAGLSQADRQIAERLDKLKEARKKDAGPVPTVGEMEERLRKLKGEAPPSTAQQPNKYYHPPDRRTQQEQVNDLLDEIHDTVEIDSHWLSPQDDVSQRLAKLKGETNDTPTKQNQDVMNNLDKSTPSHPEYTKNIGLPVNPDEDPGFVNPADVQRLIRVVADELKIDEERAVAGLQKDKELLDRLNKLKMDRAGSETKKMNTDIVQEENEEEDEEEAAKQIIRRVLEEQALSEVDENASGANQYDPEELPWCCICNADGELRCHGCDGDIYCRRCYREGHDNVDRHDHTTSPYKPPGKSKKA